MYGRLVLCHKTPLHERRIRPHAPLRVPSGLTHLYVEQLGRQMLEPMLGFGSILSS